MYHVSYYICNPSSEQITILLKNDTILKSTAAPEIWCTWASIKRQYFNFFHENILCVSLVWFCSYNYLTQQAFEYAAISLELQIWNFTYLNGFLLWVRLKTGISGPPPPPPNFGAIAYWSRAFVCNTSRLLIGRELAQLPLAGNYCQCFSLRTASDASTTCLRLGTVRF